MDFQSNSFIPPSINPPTPHCFPFMIPNGEPCPLWFAVYEDSIPVPAKVTAYTRQDIDDLKNFINARRPDILASEMHLWKVGSFGIYRSTFQYPSPVVP